MVAMIGNEGALDCRADGLAAARAVAATWLNRVGEPRVTKEA